MFTATVTSKGQVTIPLALRKALGLHAGSRLDFVQAGAGKPVTALQNSSAALKGRFAGWARKPVTLAAMDQAIAQQAAARLNHTKTRSAATPTSRCATCHNTMQPKPRVPRASWSRS